MLLFFSLKFNKGINICMFSPCIVSAHGRRSSWGKLSAGQRSCPVWPDKPHSSAPPPTLLLVATPRPGRPPSICTKSRANVAHQSTVRSTSYTTATGHQWESEQQQRQAKATAGPALCWPRPLLIQVTNQTSIIRMFSIITELQRAKQV